MPQPAEWQAVRSVRKSGESSGHQESDVIELILNVPAGLCFSIEFNKSNIRYEFVTEKA